MAVGGADGNGRRLDGGKVCDGLVLVTVVFLMLFGALFGGDEVGYDRRRIVAIRELQDADGNLLARTWERHYWLSEVVGGGWIGKVRWIVVVVDGVRQRREKAEDGQNERGSQGELALGRSDVFARARAPLFGRLSKFSMPTTTTSASSDSTTK
jgi:hypothetical protein